MREGAVREGAVPSGPSQQRVTTGYHAGCRTVLLLGVELRVELGRERRAARPPPGEECAQRGQIALSQEGEAGAAPLCIAHFDTSQPP